MRTRGFIFEGRFGVLSLGTFGRIFLGICSSMAGFRRKWKSFLTMRIYRRRIGKKGFFRFVYFGVKVFSRVCVFVSLVCISIYVFVCVLMEVLNMLWDGFYRFSCGYEFCSLAFFLCR